MNSLKKALEVAKREIISFVGAGGKTTAMFTLAKELQQDNSVLVTTTTRINFPFGEKVVLAASLSEALAKIAKYKNPLGSIVLGTGQKEGKLYGIPPDWVGELKQHFPYVLVEADGSSRKPLKGYEAWEPVIPGDSTLVLAVTGMSAIGNTFDEEHVHRARLLAASSCIPPGTAVSELLVARANDLLAGLIREQAPAARTCALLNQLTLSEGNNCKSLAAWLLDNCYDRVLAGHLLPEVDLLKATKNPPKKLAGIVLAAGLSSRMKGRNKLLLPWQQQTIVRQVVDETVASLERVVVVVGYQQELIRRELAGLPINIVYNDNYHQGQSYSLVAGLKAIGPKMEGAMFILGDQPLVPARQLQTLACAFQLTDADAIYPVYQGRRGNPVIFSHSLFDSLLTLKGDQGGRELLQMLGRQALAVPSNISGIIKDIDTFEEWQKETNDL